MAELQYPYAGLFKSFSSAGHSFGQQKKPTFPKGYYSDVNNSIDGRIDAKNHTWPSDAARGVEASLSKVQTASEQMNYQKHESPSKVTARKTKSRNSAFSVFPPPSKPADPKPCTTKPRMWNHRAKPTKFRARFFQCSDSGKIQLLSCDGNKIEFCATQLSIKDLEYVEMITGQNLSMFKPQGDNSKMLVEKTAAEIEILDLKEDKGEEDKEGNDEELEYICLSEASDLGEDWEKVDETLDESEWTEVENKLVGGVWTLSS